MSPNGFLSRATVAAILLCGLIAQGQQEPQSASHSNEASVAGPGVNAPRSAFGNAGAKLSGVVYFSGDVMPGFPVSRYSSDQVLQTEADKAGRFEFADLPPGTYDVQAKYLARSVLQAPARPAYFLPLLLLSCFPVLCQELIHCAANQHRNCRFLVAR